MSTGTWGRSIAVWALFAGVVAVSASAESKARIVRLSDVQGSVQMDRATGDGYDKTFLNMPVVEGSRLKTGDEGRAEVEFEDGSALRLVPNSEVEFTRLSLGDDGQKLNTMHLTSGMAYVNYRGKKGDEFALNFGRESVILTESAHFRVSLRTDDATVAVMKGRLSVNGPSGPLAVDQKRTATFILADDRSEIAKGFEPAAFDAWDKQQSEYRDRYGNSTNSSPYSYGMSDLNYYGGYSSIPGYGLAWQPYFMDASWSPFQDGGWVYYPGSGYMWVSSYPWGWMPYRYGNWAYAPGYGWFWQPGLWNSWYAVPRVVNPPHRVAVPVPPVRSRATVMVGRGLTVNPPSTMAQGRLTIAPGSAGLGVPRGTIRNLDRFSREVNHNNRSVEVAADPRGRIAPPSHSSNGGSVGSANSGPRPPSSSYPASQASAPRAAPSAPRTPSAPARSSRPH